MNHADHFMGLVKENFWLVEEKNWQHFRVILYLKDEVEKKNKYSDNLIFLLSY